MNTRQMLNVILFAYENRTMTHGTQVQVPDQSSDNSHHETDNTRRYDLTG